MRCCLFFLLFIITQVSNAQKREELFDYTFRPSATAVYYRVITEKKDSGWYREAWYVHQKSLALRGWYKDEACKQPHGWQEQYHHTGFLKSKGEFIEGRKSGIWLTYSEKGSLTDSTTYHNNKPVGISVGWQQNGSFSDSTYFDEDGKGLQKFLSDDGKLLSKGQLTADKKKTGLWQHFYPNGTVMTTEEYDNGKLKNCLCYDEDGIALDKSICVEQEAELADGPRQWKVFLERSVQSLVDRKTKSKEWTTGHYTVLIRFAVEKDGSLGDMVPLTAYGNGMEDELIKVIKRAPRWVPGHQWGRPVRSYYTQPISFVID